MAVNTDYQETSATVFSSVSLNGTGTLSALTVTGGKQTLTSTLSVNGAVTLLSTLTVSGAITGQGGATINSGTTLAQLGVTGILTSSATTAQSASTAKIVNGQIIFSILSLTTNGAALYYRSGNSTYVWPSSGAIG